MRYQETRSNEDLADAPVERWEPVASSSRPAHNFVPAVSRSPELPSTFWQPPNSDLAIWQPTEGVREETSAQDRAWGYNIRLLWPFGLAVILALTGMVTFIVVMRWMATPVDGLVSFLVFLLCLAVTFAVVVLRISSADYRHSHAGVELERIRAASEVRMAEAEQAHELRRMALESYIGRLTNGQPD